MAKSSKKQKDKHPKLFYPSETTQNITVRKRRVLVTRDGVRVCPSNAHQLGLSDVQLTEAVRYLHLLTKEEGALAARAGRVWGLKVQSKWFILINNKPLIPYWFNVIDDKTIFHCNLGFQLLKQANEYAKKIFTIIKLHESGSGKSVVLKLRNLKKEVTEVLRHQGMAD